ncbi:putative ribosomal protein L14 [Helianthus annuus]|nr:putative ribosomal protein L14 [Helianthus annuus]
MVRGQMNFKRLTLTDIKIDIKRVPNKKTLIAAMEVAGIIISEMVDVKSKWENSSWGRKLIVQKKRASLNDFDWFGSAVGRVSGQWVRVWLNPVRKLQVGGSVKPGQIQSCSGQASAQSRFGSCGLIACYYYVSLDFI